MSNGIPCIHVGAYDMKDPVTRERLSDVCLDVVTVVGWQRLIPEWFLLKIPCGVYGMHGSALPLPKGRGRSPMNWSIIEGRDRFYTHLFRYDAGIDSGEIVDCQRFDINPWDTIRSLQHKNSVSQYKLLVKNLPAILNGAITSIPQDKAIQPSFYPKRTFEDGAIDWKQSSAIEIAALVRAVARPYPGAYTEFENTRIMIWQAAPFDSCIEYPEAAPGTIVEAFSDKTFVVKCFVDSLLVLECETTSAWQPACGMRFTSLPNASRQKLAQMKIDEGA